MSLFAGLSFVGGIGTLAMQAVLAASRPEFASHFGSSFAVQLNIGLAFLGVLGVASGVGMWKGRAWGWWLGVFGLLYGIVKSYSIILLAPDFVEHFGVPPDEAAKVTSRHAGRILVRILLIAYLFRRDVECYFGIEERKRWQRLAMLTGATALFVAIATLIGWVLG